MKKRFKVLFFLSSLVGVIATINYLIFRLAKRNIKKINEFYYEWRFGKIRYIVTGEGEPLLLVHGIGAGISLYEWERNINSLAKHYKVYALDLLGFGFSDKPKISYSSYLYITLINDFIKDVIRKPVSVIASSHSAAFVLKAYSFRPEAFKKMILISPTGIGKSNIKDLKINIWMKNLIETPIIGTFVYNIITSRAFSKWFLESKCYSGNSKVTTDLINKYYNCAHYGGVGAKYPIAAFVSNFLNIDIESVINQIKIPVMIVWGEENDLVPISDFEKIRELNNQIGLTVFHDTKLLPHVENSRGFYKLCRRVLK